jgi:eukaryotic-like serine/threonine-protein kinase
VARPLIQRDPPPHSPPTGLELQPKPARPPRSPRPPKPPEKSGGKRRVPFFAVIAVLVAGLIGIGIWALSGDSTVAVPQVVGKDNASAVQDIQDAGLQPNIQRERSDTVRNNTVIRTVPASGKMKKGSTVTIVVSSGPPIVPNVAPGATEDTARQSITAEGLKPEKDPSQDQFDDRVTKGAVLRLSPSPGTQLKNGDSVVIVLSKGPAPLKPLPDVRGQSVDDAKRLLGEAGYNDITVAQTFDPQIENGKVISTDPGAGATPANKKVSLLVSNAVTVPQLVNRRVEEARDILKGLGLQLDVVGFGGGRGNRDDDNRRIAFQQPNAGSRVQKGSTVQVAVGFF